MARQKIADDVLDRLGLEALRACTGREDEINKAATSPFLFRRLTVQIECEQRRLAETRNRWAVWLGISRRAVPIIALVMIMVLGSVWIFAGREQQNAGQPMASADMRDDATVLGNDEILIDWKQE
jgi:hypothetical protein